MTIELPSKNRDRILEEIEEHINEEEYLIEKEEDRIIEVEKRIKRPYSRIPDRKNVNSQNILEQLAIDCKFDSLESLEKIKKLVKKTGVEFSPATYNQVCAELKEMYTTPTDQTIS